MRLHVYARSCYFPPISEMKKPAPKFPEERQQLILQRLSQGGRVVALDLAREWHTSEDTIRRDLRELARAGLCQRTYGGALPVAISASTFAERQGIASESKTALARLAVSLIRPGQLLFLDTSTTNLEIARALPANADLRVATHTPAIALAAMTRPGVSVLLIGGVLDAVTSAALGARALRDVQALGIDLCFLGVCAISLDDGLRATHFEDSEFKRALVARSNVVAAPITTDKLETTAPFEIAPFDQIDHLLLEKKVDPRLVGKLRRKGPTIHQ